MRSSTWLFILVTIFIMTGNQSVSSQGKPGYNPYGKSPVYKNGWIDFNKSGTMDPYENPSLDIDARVEDLLRRMTVEEKTCQLATLYGYKKVLTDSLPTPEWKNRVWKDGIANIDEQLNGYRSDVYSWPPSAHAKAINEIQRWFIEETRLGIPVDFTNEGIYGACFTGATLFPPQIGVGSTWDKALVASIGEITSRQSKAVGFTNVYSPILDVARDPRWGRVVECYGEDPYLVAQLGLQQILGIQKDHTVISTPKHFAAYSIPIGGRDHSTRTDPQIAPREMLTLLLEPFRVAFMKGDAHGTMSSYNDYDGVPVTGSYWFLTKLLRQEYGFRGYVVSDSEALEYLWSKHRVAPDYKDAIRQALDAGMNVRTTFRSPESYIMPLRELIAEGSLSMDVVDSRVRDVLWVKFWLGLFDEPYVMNPEAADRLYSDPGYEKISMQASYESMILLKNRDNFLPLDRTKIRTILIAGPNATDKTLSISRYGPKKIEYKSVLEAFREKLEGSVDVLYARGCDIIDRNWPQSEILPSLPSAEEMAGISDAVTKAMQSDVVILVIGENNSIVGESHSRTDLDLAGFQELLLEKIIETGRPVVLVLMNGRVITVNRADRDCVAIIEAWFPGKYGGEALADIVLGDYNPGGKLTVTFPKSVGQIPMCFPYKPAAQADSPTTVNGVLYPFGHGLSFTTFEYSNLMITPEKQFTAGNVEVSVDIRNTGTMAGDEVVQLYIGDEVSSVIRYEKELRGFERISLAPGESKTVHFTLTPEELWMIDANMQWKVEAGWFTVMAGSSSQDIRVQGRFEILPAERVSEAYDPTPISSGLTW
ncbi:MAG: glycoside hydrolase family 3 N-terminal domain-containing protein [Bacteroidales bacterium]|jgi:beta-glucosidase|nr:glycoside hydrolase family 3 N-terminal domain-containing protein [Bacteroidales bacterium]